MESSKESNVSEAPIAFKEYHSINVKGRATKRSFRKNDDEQWVALEKVHGCNFSFICNGTTIRGARRGALLDDAETFHGWQKIREKYRESIFGLFRHLNTDPKITKEGQAKLLTITIYGELFGGLYPHDEVEDFKICQVQKSIYYSNTIDFYAFDVFITVAEGDKQTAFWCNYGDAMKWFEKFNFFYARPIVQGSLDDCLACKSKINTTIPAYFNLPPLHQNQMEGLVIKSLEPQFTAVGQRFIFKVKNPNFEEINPIYKESEYEKERKLKLDSIDKYYEESERYINKNRLESVISKMTEEELKIENLDFIVNKFCEDIFKDFAAGNGDESHAEIWAILSRMEDVVMERLRRNTKSRVSIFVKNWFDERSK